MRNKIEELKKKIEEQRKQNVELFNSIPIPSRQDPLNKKADPILEEWRKGSKILKSKLQELETRANNKMDVKESNKSFVNSFGEATKRNITCSAYERSQKQNAKAMLSFIGSK